MNYFPLWLLLVPVLFAETCRAQDQNPRNEYSFMFYNTENFFDSKKDSLTDDKEYTPAGIRQWNSQRFQAKANRIAKVILAAGKWNAPILVGLCETENRQVLETLTRNTPLSSINYKIVHKDSPDERGIDVALIYRPDIFRPFDYEAIPVIDPADPTFKTRDILEVSGVLNGCDTLHIFINHWPSKYGGAMETRKLRTLAALTLKKAISQAASKSSSAKIICMGDFNETPEDEILTDVLGAKPTQDLATSGDLVNLAFRWVKNPVQTIKNQYSWQVFDQWIVTGNFLAEKDCFKFLKAEIFAPEFLLEPDLKFGGVKPKRTFVGYKYQEGFSDHLPILLRIQLSAR